MEYNQHLNKYHQVYLLIQYKQSKEWEKKVRNKLEREKKRSDRGFVFLSVEIYIEFNVSIQSQTLKQISIQTNRQASKQTKAKKKKEINL